MKQRVLSVVGLGLLLALLATSTGLASPAVPAGGGGPVTLPPSMRPYSFKTVDSRSSPGFGSYLSLARDPMNGRIYISYYDSVNGNLMLADNHTGSEGNCGPGGSWSCETIDDSAGSVGLSPSIDIFDSPTVHKLGIAYLDATSTTNTVLKFAEYACAKGVLCIWEPKITLVSDRAFFQNGIYSVSLKYDSLGIAHIAYTAKEKLFVSGGAELWYASYTGSGNDPACGNGFFTKWTCQALAYLTIPGDTGLYPVLAMNRSNHARIAYYEPASNRLAYLQYDGAPPVIKYVTSAHIRGLSFALYEPTQAEFAEIAYIDDPGTGGQLKHVHYTGSMNSTSCGSSEPWLCETVTEVGVGTRGVSLALDHGGYPLIAYEDAPDEFSPSSVKIAQMWQYGPGNCGPSSSWQCEWIETPGADTYGYVSMGSYIQLLIDPNNLGQIAYYRDDSYDPGAGAVRFAYQTLPVYLPLVWR